MLSTRESIAPDGIINKAVHVEIDLAAGGKRYIHGMVSQFIGRGRQQLHTAFTAIVRPWFWYLSLWQDCRIFQELSVPEIAEKIFQDGGFSDFELKRYKEHAQREYCVQYRESSMDFISRLLEEEGIFYYFDHTADKHTLVLSDQSSTCSPCPGGSTGRLSAMAETVFRDDVVTSVEHEVRTATAKVTLQDYNFETPKQNLQAKAAGTGKPEAYDYPGKYADRGKGDQYAGIRLEELETPVTILRGEGNCRSFVAGHKFDLKDHHVRSLNTSYLLTRVHLSMATNSYRTNVDVREDYQNRFEAIPATVPYRPPRVTKKPVISGVQTAVIVGPSGEEIYSDKYGRVKVQFFWDREGKKNENSSCWLRVSQDWAGKNWGADLHSAHGPGSHRRFPRRRSGPAADHRARLQRRADASLYPAWQSNPERHEKPQLQRRRHRQLQRVFL